MADEAPAKTSLSGIFSAPAPSTVLYRTDRGPKRPTLGDLLDNKLRFGEERRGSGIIEEERDTAAVSALEVVTCRRRDVVQ